MGPPVAWYVDTLSKLFYAVYRDDGFHKRLMAVALEDGRVIHRSS